MKKGLRRWNIPRLRLLYVFKTRPDEEGIKTISPRTPPFRKRSSKLALMKKGLRPAVENIEGFPQCFKTRPDEEGIKTRRSGLDSSQMNSSKLALMKKGLRRVLPTLTFLNVAGFKTRPDEEGIKTLRAFLACAV